jgi:hypothetical protein
MGKRLNVLQLMQKKYTPVEGLSPEIKASIGDLEDTFPAIIYGGSGNGKTNFVIKLLLELKSLGDILYISYEEAHGKTIQDLIIRHNLAEKLPNLRFSDGETKEELFNLLKRKQSPKIIVIDSWQFSGLTSADFEKMFKHFLFGKSIGRRKIFLVISHIKGKEPDGSSAMNVKRLSHIKMYVEKYVMFPISRFGGNKPFVIWEEGAKTAWGDDYNHKVFGTKKPPKKKKHKPKEMQMSVEPVTKMQVAAPAAKPLFKEPLNDN